MLGPSVLLVPRVLLALLAPRLLDRATPLLDSMLRRSSSRASTPHLVLVIGAVAVVVPVPVLDTILGSPVCHTLLRDGSPLDKGSRLELRARGTTLDTLLDPMDLQVRQAPQACPVLLRQV